MSRTGSSPAPAETDNEGLAAAKRRIRLLEQENEGPVCDLESAAHRSLDLIDGHRVKGAGRRIDWYAAERVLAVDEDGR